MCVLRYLYVWRSTRQNCRGHIYDPKKKATPYHQDHHPISSGHVDPKQDKLAGDAYMTCL